MATKYGTHEGFDAYFLARGITISPSLHVDVINASLLVASEWIDNNFRAYFPGLKTGLRDQEREWPRTGATDYYTYAIPADTIPVEVENATYELALIEAKTPGSLSVNYTPEKYKSVSIDGALSVEYVQFSNSQDIQTKFRKVQEILSNILVGSGNHSMLSGFASRV